MERAWGRGDEGEVGDERVEKGGWEGLWGREAIAD